MDERALRRHGSLTPDKVRVQVPRLQTLSLKLSPLADVRIQADHTFSVPSAIKIPASLGSSLTSLTYHGFVHLHGIAGLTRLKHLELQPAQPADWREISTPAATLDCQVTRHPLLALKVHACHQGRHSCSCMQRTFCCLSLLANVRCCGHRRTLHRFNDWRCSNWLCRVFT